MTERDASHPPHHTRAIRTLLRFALVFLVVGLLSGVAFQESVKKLGRRTGDGLTHWDATLHLALVHGHMIVTGVLLPIALAGMLHLARSHGGHPLGPRALAWSLYTLLPGVVATCGLMLYKGYHTLLAARSGEVDMAQIDVALFAGGKALRHSLYGISHVGLALGLGIFAVCLWRSLRKADA